MEYSVIKRVHVLGDYNLFVCLFVFYGGGGGRGGGGCNYCYTGIMEEIKSNQDRIIRILS